MSDLEFYLTYGAIPVGAVLAAVGLFWALAKWEK